MGNEHIAGAIIMFLVFWWLPVVGVSAIVISVAGTLGVLYLIAAYKRIEKKYFVKA